MSTGPQPQHEDPQQSMCALFSSLTPAGQTQDRVSRHPKGRRRQTDRQTDTALRLHIWSVCVVQLSGTSSCPQPRARSSSLFSHGSLGRAGGERAGGDSKRSGGRRGGWGGGKGRCCRAGPQDCPPQRGSVSHRQPKAVLLLLHRFEGGQSAEVLLGIRLLHFVIS